MNVSAMFIQFIRLRLLGIDSFVLTRTHSHSHAQISNEVLFLGIVVILRRETSSSLSRVCRRPFKELKTKVLFFIRFLFFLFYFLCVFSVFVVRLVVSAIKQTIKPTI